MKWVSDSTIHIHVSYLKREMTKGRLMPTWSFLLKKKSIEKLNAKEKQIMGNKLVSNVRIFIIFFLLFGRFSNILYSLGQTRRNRNYLLNSHLGFPLLGGENSPK